MRHPLSITLACVVTASLPLAAPPQTDSFLGKPLSHWASALGDKEARTRRSAAFALGRIGSPAVGSAGELIRLIDSAREPEAEVRDMAASALGDIVKAAPGAASDLWPLAGRILQKALGNDTSPRVRRSVAYALGTFGPQAASASTALREALASRDADIRQNAAWAIGQLGKLADEDAVAALRDRLGDDSALVRRDAATALGRLGALAAARGVPALMDLVQRETDEVVRKAGLDALAHLAGPEHRVHADPLQKLLEDRDAETARGAALVLARVGGPPAIPAVPILRKALKDSDVQVQRLAAAGLEKLKEEAAPAVADLAEALSTSSDTEVRRLAALALGHLGEKALSAVPALGAALRPPAAPELRLAAAEALHQLGYPSNAAAVPNVLKAIRDDTDPVVRQRCIWSLFKVEDLDRVEGARDVLEKVLDERNADSNAKMVRYDAARVLANKLGDKAPDHTIDVLMDMLTNRSLHVFEGTKVGVEGTGNEASGGKTSVNESVGGDARYMAVQALGWLGSKASSRKDVVAALREAAREPNAKMKDTARKALENLSLEP